MQPDISVLISQQPVAEPNHESVRTGDKLALFCKIQCNVPIGAIAPSESGKDKFHPRTGHEVPKGEQRYSSTLSLTSALDVDGWSTTRPGRFTPRERPGTICTGRWVVSSACLDGCGNSRLHRDSIPGPSCPLRIAIPTELSRPTLVSQGLIIEASRSHTAIGRTPLDE
jgi:hypothetical protein